MNFLGFFKKSINSCTSSFSSVKPATSLNVALLSSTSLALDFPKSIDLFPPPSCFVNTQITSPPNIMYGTTLAITNNHDDASGSFIIVSLKDPVPSLAAVIFDINSSD